MKWPHNGSRPKYDVDVSFSLTKLTASLVNVIVAALFSFSAQTFT